MASNMKKQCCIGTISSSFVVEVTRLLEDLYTTGYIGGKPNGKQIWNISIQNGPNTSPYDPDPPLLFMLLCSCYQLAERETGTVARQCKEPLRKDGLSSFKDKLLLRKLKRKWTNHEDGACDSDVEFLQLHEGTHCSADRYTFGQLVITGANQQMQSMGPINETFKSLYVDYQDSGDAPG
ncbi:hypothetical protein Tco_0659805 [Tanacetum coccineum]